MFDPENDRNQVVDNIIQNQIKIALTKFSIVMNKDHSKMDWATQDEAMSQITASFNPIDVSEEDWYGDYYVE